MTDQDPARSRHDADENGLPEDRAAAEAATSAKPDAKQDRNPAGPHSKPELTDESKTPGTGMLSDPGDSNEAPSG
ncbi:hypothetical protein [Rhodopseudomonas telluris]|uniref:Uncharacterized protein n=1 Tax=Rhodopseudomonas telluris TaxID=644215 RepID=A0ABV6EVU0_9BRAD